MLFQIGDKVIHPVYGVGTILTYSNQQLYEKSYDYYQVIAGKTTVWVPLGAQGSSVLRKIASKACLAQCRKLLKQPPVALNHDRKKRQAEIARLLKGGLLPALCETVRDLTAHSRQRALGLTERELLKKTFKGLCDEWAASSDVSTRIALDEIEALLLEGH